VVGNKGSSVAVDLETEEADARMAAVACVWGMERCLGCLVNLATSWNQRRALVDRRDVGSVELVLSPVAS
jgi:hypothetical protein